MDGEYFWNICDIWEEESTRDGAQGGHEAGGAPQGGRCALIRLCRIYNFLLFHANIIQLSYTFGNFLYYFLGLTYRSGAQ